MVVPAKDLPLIRHSERVDYKRCQKKWYWRWRRGLVPKAKTYGALDLGAWMHEALARFYSGTKEDLHGYFIDVTDSVSQDFFDAPEHIKAQAQDQITLGMAMTKAYDARYGSDPNVKVIAAEIPLEFPISLDGEVIAIHKLKPDLVYADENDEVWLMEHKTAGSIRLEHLPIDDQARPYVTMAEPALRAAGVIKRGQQFKGVMYNFLRKAVPDSRPMDAQGRYLNKNGTVSKSQPPPYFVRHPVTMTRESRRIALLRLRLEAVTITEMTKAIREKRIDPKWLNKTPHNSCPKFCDFFTMCTVEEQGGNVRDMERNMYERRNPYTYDEETTDIPVSFDYA